jgi:hypothetical protein
MVRRLWIPDEYGGEAPIEPAFVWQDLAPLSARRNLAQQLHDHGQAENENDLQQALRREDPVEGGHGSQLLDIGVTAV